jgi:biopolymer transport protein TolR
MGMNSGSKGNAVSEINVTPLIDVLLVLLIIFMVIVPAVPKGLKTLIPQPSQKPMEDDAPPQTIVVQVLSNGYKINGDSFAKSEIEPKLAAIFATRSEKTMFVKGDQDLDYSLVAEVIDLGKHVGVDRIGLITPKSEAGN